MPDWSTCFVRKLRHKKDFLYQGLVFCSVVFSPSSVEYTEQRFFPNYFQLHLNNTRCCRENIFVFLHAATVKQQNLTACAEFLLIGRQKYISYIR